MTSVHGWIVFANPQLCRVILVGTSAFAGACSASAPCASSWHLGDNLCHAVTYSPSALASGTIPCSGSNGSPSTGLGKSSSGHVSLRDFGEIMLKYVKLKTLCIMLSRCVQYLISSIPARKSDTTAFWSSSHSSRGILIISFTSRVHAKGVVLCERACFCLLSAF